MKNGGNPLRSYREAALQKKIEALQSRLDMSRNMLQKLYRKHVHLEKEMQVQKVLILIRACENTAFEPAIEMGNLCSSR